MARVRIKGLSKVINNIEKKLNGARIDASSKKVMCNIIEEDTKQTIRDGRNPNTVNSARIKKLKQSTIENRMRIARKRKTHPDFVANKSNLTLTGRLIDSIRCKFRRLKRGVSFELKGTGKNRNGVSNNAIFKFQKDMGRDVLGIRGHAKRQVLRILKELYVDVLKK